MTMQRSAVALAMTTGVLLSAAPAMAGFWTPLDTVPHPNFIIGLDTSVTMGIRSDCSSCHGPSNPNTRLNEAKVDILNTLPMFQNYFVFGGFEYSGCNYAKINTRVLPRPDNPPISYNGVTNMVSSAGHCGSRENYFPGGGGAASGCITPTPGCAGDPPILNALLAGSLPGLSIPAPAIPDPTVNLACDTPSPPQPTYNLAASLLAKLGAGNFGWPRWDVAITGAQVLNDLCNPLSNVLNLVNAELSACFVDPTTVWDLSFLGAGTWCTPGTIAGAACTTSPLVGTCVCDDTIPGCVSAAMPASECGTLLTWKARQQVAVCEMYSTANASRLGSYYLSQADNIARGECRENVGLFLTDGYEGHRAGVGAEAVNALNFYRSADGLSNLFVFRISGVFAGDSNTMMNYVTGGQITTAFLATDAATMQESFAKVLSRIYKGVYTGANMATDQYQTRAVFHSFTVVGYQATGPVTDTYLGFPSRISVHEIFPNGAINASPRFESDWDSRVTAAPGCGPFTVGGTDVARLGPGGSFRNGISRNQLISAGSTDRDGDGMIDSHPALRYGRSYGFAAGGALVVDAPRAANPGTDSAEIADYINFIKTTAVQQRPRVIYYTDGGYLIGIHGGRWQSGQFNYGTQSMTFTYDDSAAPAGAEVLRFRPSWLNNPTAKYSYAVNDLVQQPLMTGELIAREVRVRVGGTDMYRTVLVGNQGKEGPGFFVVDVTDPCTAPAFTTNITLPAGSYASAEPTIYTFPMSAAPRRRAVLVTTGGLGGASTMFAYDVVTGAQLASVGLPAQGGQSYATAPVCVDVTGEGTVTHCYALRTDGFLARARVQLSGFAGAVDVTPIDGGGVQHTMQGGRRYFTSPVAFFDSDGEVNLVFGSGDYQNLTQAPATNFVYRVRDATTRQSGVPNANTRLDQVCRPDGGGNTNGIIPLGAGERVLSKPVVSGGVVAWSTYISTTDGCIAGTGVVYAMDFETCADVMTPGNTRPAGTGVGAGIPTTPVVHRQSESLLVQTSAGPTGAQVTNDTVATRTAGRLGMKRLYWRLDVDNP
jgi:hypothetical protein